MARQTRPDGAGPTEPPPDLDEDAEAAAAARRQDILLDEAIEETFPASDPISPMMTR